MITMDSIAPEPSLETLVLQYFAPRLFLHGHSVEVDAKKYRVGIRPGNVKIRETDDNEYGPDALIFVEGERVGVIDPERKTEWAGGEWPSNWTVNVAVYPRNQYDSGLFNKNSRTKKLQFMKDCASRGEPGFIVFYSNAFGDSGNFNTRAKPDSKRSALLVPALALYSQNGDERLPVGEQVNNFGRPLPVFKVPIEECFLAQTPQEFENFILSLTCSFIRSRKNED